MNLQEILDNAPEGATHVQFSEYYWKVDSSQYFEWYKSCKQWIEVTDEDDIDLFDGFRALSDIKRIIELGTQLNDALAENQDQHDRIVESERLLVRRDLEQQAKGVEDFADRYCGTSIELEHEAVRACAYQQVGELRSQAKGKDSDN